MDRTREWFKAVQTTHCLAMLTGEPRVQWDSLPFQPPKPTDIVTTIEAGDQAVCRCSRVWCWVWILIPLEETSWYFLIFSDTFWYSDFDNTLHRHWHFGTNCGHERKSFQNRNLKMVVWQLASTLTLVYEPVGSSSLMNQLVRTIGHEPYNLLYLGISWYILVLWTSCCVAKADSSQQRDTPPRFSHPEHRSPLPSDPQHRIMEGQDLSYIYKIL